MKYKLSFYICEIIEFLMLVIVPLSFSGFGIYLIVKNWNEDGGAILAGIIMGITGIALTSMYKSDAYI
jgi:hypothetical protein